MRNSHLSFLSQAVRLNKVAASIEWYWQCQSLKEFSLRFIKEISFIHIYINISPYLSYAHTSCATASKKCYIVLFAGSLFSISMVPSFVEHMNSVLSLVTGEQFNLLLVPGYVAEIKLEKEYLSLFWIDFKLYLFIWCLTPDTNKFYCQQLKK